MSEPDGKLVPLSTAIGDDGSPSWAPDESAIAFETAMWDRLGHLDLAIVERKTRKIRRLTAGEASDQLPRWSPDGSHVAFVRRYFDGSEREVGWIPVDGGVANLIRLDGVTAGAVLGWLDHRRILVQADSNGALALRIVDIMTRTVVSTNAPDAESVSLSPGGQWLLFHGIVAGTPRAAWWVAPVKDPPALRELGGASDASSRAHWGGIPRDEGYLETLHLEGSEVVVPEGGTHKLAVEGLNQHGKTYQTPMLSWWSADTTVATVTQGILRALRQGSVMIHVSAGGWRSDSVRITIGSPTHSPLLDETWDHGLAVEWVPFGEPRPTVVRDSVLGPALWSHGDGAYMSGVFSRHSWMVREGLGVEAVVAVPLNAVQWQVQKLWLDASLDSAAMSGSRDLADGLDPIRRQLSGTCYMSYPDDEGPPATARVITVLGGMETRKFAPPMDMKHGAPHRLRIQIFADGRCGFALDGQALWVSRGTVPREPRYRVVLEGKSLGTRVLVGQLEVWQGVRRDVDWKAVKPNRP